METVSVDPNENRGTGQHLRPTHIAHSGGAISFTFDDFPKSALSVGGELLEKYGYRGTYYAALGMAGGESPSGTICDFDEIRAAHGNGHEIACHTWSHLNCKQAQPEEILTDIAANTEALAALLDGYVASNFAFPYGAISPGAKSVLADRFESCRGIKWGTNSGTVDLTSLASTHLYSRDFDEAALCGLIDRNRELGGWLIFYTHDLTEAPSPYGCTPRQFETVLSYAATHGEILPVRDVMSRIRPNS